MEGHFKNKPKNYTQIPYAPAKKVESEEKL